MTQITEPFGEIPGVIGIKCLDLDRVCPVPVNGTGCDGRRGCLAQRKPIVANCECCSFQAPGTYWSWRDAFYWLIAACGAEPSASGSLPESLSVCRSTELFCNLRVSANSLWAAVFSPDFKYACPSW